MGKLPVEKEENIHKTVTLFTAEIVALLHISSPKEATYWTESDILTVAIVSSG